MCYDTRLRDLASETSLSAASGAFAEVRGRLRRLTGEGRTVEGGRKVRLKALTPECVVVESTWDREVSRSGQDGRGQCMRDDGGADSGGWVITS